MQELIWETLYMSLFVFAASYGLHYLAYQRGLNDENDEVTKATIKSNEDNTRIGKLFSNPLVNKWLDFGGGYYGIVALVKLVFIEIGQVQSFFESWDGTGQFIDSIGFNLLVAFFVEQIQNFVAAIIWPTDYLSRFSILECAVFIAVTYGVYNGAKRLAKEKA